jgi:hypothetical protein
VLRWVRRVSVAGVVPLVAVALLVWGGEDRFLWPVIAVAAVVIVNAALMGPAIRRADEHGAATDPDELARRRREGNRGLAVIVAVMLTRSPRSDTSSMAREQPLSCSPRTSCIRWPLSARSGGRGIKPRSAGRYGARDVGVVRHGAIY